MRSVSIAYEKGHPDGMSFIHGADNLVVVRCTRQAYPVGMPCPRVATPPLPTAQGRVGDPGIHQICSYNI